MRTLSTLLKRRLEKILFETERYFKFVEENENEVIVPRGFIGKLIRFCQGKISNIVSMIQEKSWILTGIFNSMLNLENTSKVLLKLYLKKVLV